VGFKHRCVNEYVGALLALSDAEKVVRSNEKVMRGDRRHSCQLLGDANPMASDLKAVRKLEPRSKNRRDKSALDG
jgi:hypothetical protein